MSDEDPVADIAVQPALPSLELPDYHGRKPTGMKTTVNGAGNRITRSHDIGEAIVLVVEAKVRKAGHDETDESGLIYFETLKVADLFEVPGRTGKRLLVALRQAYRISDDTAQGRARLPLEKTGAVLGPAGWTDEHGNALSEEDLAEIRGDQFLASLNDGTLDPVALVFADGTRRLWPDDFDPGVARPQAGDFIDDDVQVRQVLDAATGETIAEWTDEQEDARLAELEEQARTEEAAENASTMADVEKARSSRVLVATEHLDPGEAGCRSCSRQLGRMHLKACQYADPFVGLPSPDGGERKGEPEVEPWDGYENEPAKDIVARVRAMGDRDAVFAVASWEEDHGGRKTILEAAARRAAELMGGD